MPVTTSPHGIQPLMTTHLCDYSGRPRTNFTIGVMYECQDMGERYRVRDDDGRMCRILKSSFTVLQEVDSMGSPIISGTPTKDPFKDGFFKQLMNVDKPKADLLAGETKKNAPTYSHKNATRRVNEVNEDTESTEELRKYRFTPEQ